MAEFKLSLVQRKNLKENEEKLQEHLQTIKDATGKDDWTMEIDWGTCYPVLQLGDRPGDTIYSSCMGGLANNIQNLCKNETAKESFVEAMSASKIVVTVDKKAASYWSEKFVNGTLEIGFKGSVCNVSDIGRKIEEQLTCTFEETVMPVVLRKNIAEQEEKHQEHMDKIKEATGRDWTFTVTWADMIKDHMGTNQSYFGSTLYDSCFGGLAENIKRICTSEYGKEAFNNFATTGNIIFNSNKNDKKAPSYFQESFVNGDLVIGYKSICNTSDIGRKIEDLLTIEFEEVTMPLVLRKNIADQEEKREEHFTKLRDATGRDFTLTIQWADMIKDHMGTNQSYFGATLYDSCLGGLADNIKRLCNNEVFSGKDAFNEFATTGNIIFNSNKNVKNAPSYFEVKFDNGDVVVSFKSICNCSDIGRNIEDLLTVSYEDNVVPYVLRRSLAQYEEKLQENIEIINTATTRTFELQVDWVKMIPFMRDVSKTQNAYVGSTLFDSVMGGLAGNLKKLCADELGQEGFNESATTGKIILTVEDDKKASYSYFQEKFENGDLVIKFKSICNCSDIGRGIEKLL